MFSLRTNSRIFEIPHTNFRISFGQDFGFFVFVNKTTTNTVWDLNIHAIKSYLTLSLIYTLSDASAADGFLKT